jgi:hypothetical protein
MDVISALINSFLIFLIFPNQYLFILILSSYFFFSNDQRWIQSKCLKGIFHSPAFLCKKLYFNEISLQEKEERPFNHVHAWQVSTDFYPLFVYKILFYWNSPPHFLPFSSHSVCIAACLTPLYAHRDWFSFIFYSWFIRFLYALQNVSYTSIYVKARG